MYQKLQKSLVWWSTNKTQYPLCICILTTLWYIFTKRPFILRAFLEIGKTSHKSSDEVILLRRCACTNVIFLKFSQKKKKTLENDWNRLKLEREEGSNENEGILTRINRVTGAPQSRHLALFSAIVLPHFKHSVMCLQELPYKSDCDPQPKHDGFSVKQCDIFVSDHRNRLAFLLYEKGNNQEKKKINNLGFPDFENPITRSDSKMNPAIFYDPYYLSIWDWYQNLCSSFSRQFFSRFIAKSQKFSSQVLWFGWEIQIYLRRLRLSHKKTDLPSVKYRKNSLDYLLFGLKLTISTFLWG